ncbi:C3a anaphylatoxin chemotactic receptor isoform X2 [Pyrgilauda ruficollis]|uniref:C3a anaphylatoxin chemotactic receptor isoform X2 n=1 Tax=Pyrgilauda ruficollis TaxID=221976 RepID=UPI001B882D44|nr:C3a anaphylatoxin chemotactic receptor isoform X2 [Pyrgilauda ruficollis]
MPHLLGNSSSQEQAAVYYASESIVCIAIFTIVFIIGIPGNGLVIWVAGLKMKSVFLLVAISIDRCLLVMKPVWCQNHRAVKFISLICSGIWMLAFIFCCPVFYYRETSTYDGKTECGYNYGVDDYIDYPINVSVNDLWEEYSTYKGSDLWGDTNEGNDSVPLASVLINVTRAVFGFVLPFGIMAVCYALIVFRTHTNQFHKSHNRTLRTVLCVVAAFFICWAPYHVVGMLSIVPSLRTGRMESLILWDHLSTALAYANSCINPLLYVFVGRDFRAKVRQSVQRILEGAFSEELTSSTLHRSQTSADKNLSSTL